MTILKFRRFLAKRIQISKDGIVLNTTCMSPNILTEYSVEIDKTESFLWLLIPENNSKRRIKTNILEFNSFRL